MSTTVEEVEKTEKREDKKSELLLDSLEIKGYRCFEHLTIEKLGRVNLIVGKNNVGKTALLEALWIYSNKGKANVLAEITLDRNERVIDRQDSENSFGFNSSKYFSAYKNLFYKRPTNYVSKDEFYVGKIKIGSLQNRNKQLTLTLNGSGTSPVIDTDNTRNPFKTDIGYFIKTSKIHNVKLIELWRNVELRITEEFVIEALKIIAEELISVRLTEYPEINSPKIPIARIKDGSEPVPLLSLGEGMNRLFVIATALANCQNGMLIVDEIESGLHYSVLPDVWKLIFKTAKDLNVQVFATTHSKDCIEAFAQAAYDSPEEGMLIRLERHGEKIVAKAIEEEMLVDAVNYEVEVR